MANYANVADFQLQKKAQLGYKVTVNESKWYVEKKVTFDDQEGTFTAWIAREKLETEKGFERPKGYCALILD